MLMSSSEVLRFPGTRSGFEGAAATLRGLLDIRRLDGALRYKVELAFEEIVTNIMESLNAMAESCKAPITRPASATMAIMSSMVLPLS